MSITSKDLILHIRNVHPTISTKNLSVILGLSRQRVDQILKKNNLPTNTRNDKSASCEYCHNPCVKPRKYCSRECLSNSRKLDFTCEECGIIFKRGVTYANMRVVRNYKHTWCSKQCQGKSLGRKHGWKKGNYMGSRV